MPTVLKVAEALRNGVDREAIRAGLTSEGG